MKVILLIIFLLILTMANFAQPKLSVPFEMKKGEKVEIGELKIKYLGGDREWATGTGSDGKHFEINYLRYRFEVTNQGKTELKQIVSPLKIGDLVLQVLSPQKVDFDKSDEVCQLLVMSSQQFSDREKRAEADLLNVGKLAIVKTFAVEPVGYAGTTSEGENLARKILAQEKAEIAFQSILKNGTPEAQLYALWGLRKIHGRGSDKILAPFRQLSDEVRRMSGCEIFTEKFSESVKEIENPFYLKMKTKDLWTMNLERRRALLTHEEENFLLSIFRIHKSSNDLDKIAEVPFGELFQKEAERILGK